jgi:hypothetical protein
MLQTHGRQRIYTMDFSSSSPSATDDRRDGGVKIFFAATVWIRITTIFLLRLFYNFAKIVQSFA